MAINNVVNTKFGVNDKITKRFGIMARAAAKFGIGTEKSFKRASRSAGRFGDVTKGVVAGLGITRGISALTSGISEVTTGFIAFEKAARGATVRFKDIGPTAEDFNAQMVKVRNSARAAGATTEFTAAQAAESLDFLARAGFSSAEAMGALGSMIDLATASGEEFTRVADISSDLLGAFGLNTDDTAQKIANLNRVNDVLVKTANSANVTLEDMFETMKVAAPVGKTLGIELEEVAALTAIMGNSGIKGSVAATALKNAFLRLSAGGKPINEMLSKIGVEIDDGSGNMRKFTDILSDVGDKIKGLGNLEQSKVLDTLFGKRAIAGASNLIDNISQLREFEKTLKSAGETSKKTAAIMRQSIDARLKTLVSTITELGFKILEAFEVRGKKGIDALTEAIRNFDVKPVIAFFDKIATGIAFVWEWRSAILAIGGAFFIFKTLIVLLGVINLIMAANPLGLFIVAIAAAVTGVVLLVTFIEELIAGLDSLPLIARIVLAPFRLILVAIRQIKDAGAALLKAFGFGATEEQAEPPATPPTPEEARRLASAEQAQTGAAAPAKAAEVNATINVAPVQGTAAPAVAPPPRPQRRAGSAPLPPNARLAEARAKASTLIKARLDIAGAPPGSKVSVGGREAEQFDVQLLGG